MKRQIVFLMIFLLLSITLSLAIFLPSCTNSNINYYGPDFIVITSPTGQDGCTTKGSSVDLAGFSTNDEFFGKITWTNSQSGSGTAKGTTEWTISDITLEPGDNIITVQTTDSSGETIEDSIMVTHNPHLDFLGSPQTTPDEFFVDEETAVVTQIAIEDNENLNTSSVQVVRVDSTNNVISTITTLADDGNQALGDETAGDGTYSGTAMFNETEETEIRLRITATTTEEGESNTAYSEVFTLSAIAHVTDDEFNRTLSMPGEVRQKFNELMAVYNVEEAITKTVEWLQSHPDVAAVGRSPESGYHIWYTMNWGMTLGLLLVPEEHKGGESILQCKQDIAKRLHSTRNSSSMSYEFKPASSQAAGSTHPRIGDKSVLLFAPFDSDFGSNSEVNSLPGIFQKAPCPKLDVVIATESCADVETCMALGAYGIVMLSSHGGITNTTTEEDQVVILTGETIDALNPRKYEKEWKKGRLVYEDVRYLDFSNTSPDEDTYITHTHFAITPDFIRYHCVTFPDSIVFASSCRSMFNGTMALAFFERGAKVYLGFSEKVYASYAKEVADTFWTEMVDQLPAIEAYGTAISIHGIHDSNPPPKSACFLFQGNSEIMIPPEGKCTSTGYTRITVVGSGSDPEYNYSAEYYSEEEIAYDPIEDAYVITKRETTCDLIHTRTLMEHTEMTTCHSELVETYEQGEEPIKFQLYEDGKSGYLEPVVETKKEDWITCTDTMVGTYTDNVCGFAVWPIFCLTEDEITDTGIKGKVIHGEFGIHTTTLEFQYEFPE